MANQEIPTMPRASSFSMTLKAQKLIMAAIALQVAAVAWDEEDSSDVLAIQKARQALNAAARTVRAMEKSVAD
jgi:hypothetical protein